MATVNTNSFSSSSGSMYLKTNCKFSSGEYKRQCMLDREHFCHQKTFHTVLCKLSHDNYTVGTVVSDI